MKINELELQSQAKDEKLDELNDAREECKV